MSVARCLLEGFDVVAVDAGDEVDAGAFCERCHDLAGEIMAPLAKGAGVHLVARVDGYHVEPLE